MFNTEELGLIVESLQEFRHELLKLAHSFKQVQNNPSVAVAAAEAEAKSKQLDILTKKCAELMRANI